MQLGSILHHKYFNGVAPQAVSQKYQVQAVKFSTNFGMFGTGMMKVITTREGGDVVYNWDNVDKLVDFALQNDLDLHYNTIITGRKAAFPDWYFQYNNSEKIDFIESHIRSVISRYKGRIETYKLLNECVNENEENYLETNLSKTELAQLMFEWAVDEHPDGKYMINEYGVIIREEIREKYLNLIQRIEKNGTRIDIVGLQGHSGYFPIPFQIPPAEMLTGSLEDVRSKTDLPIQITEFDLSYRNHTGESYEGSEIDPKLPFEVEGEKYLNWFEYQQEAYGEYVARCEESGVVEKLYFWMFADDPEITWERVGCGLLDVELNEKSFLTNYYRNK